MCTSHDLLTSTSELISSETSVTKCRDGEFVVFAKLLSIEANVLQGVALNRPQEVVSRPCSDMYHVSVIQKQNISLNFKKR